MSDNVHGDKMAGDKIGGHKISAGDGATININSAPPQPERPLDRNRKNYLNALKTTWIDGFLHQSLHSEVIKLTMTEADGELLARDDRQRSWGMVKRQAGQDDEPIPLTKPVGDIFEESGRGLLILGDPGSGKTITLLQLAEQLMNAAASPDQLMPVVLNLSSWGQTRPPLIEWLVEEIFVQYSVGRSLARRWIEENQFVYLLDGLDEVATDARNECIEAINTFRADRTGVVEMAVCSRTKDYDQLTARLNLTAAIQIKPLTNAQVDAYLRQPKLEMQAVQATLKTDPTLRELTRSPLWLNVMTLAYRGKTRTELGMMTGVDARRTHLFDTYIDAMFVRRPLLADSDYSEADARHWLTEVAHGLTNHNLSELYLEKLQPDWLISRKSDIQYTIISGMAIVLPVSILMIILAIGFSGASVINLRGGLSDEMYLRAFGMIMGTAGIFFVGIMIIVLISVVKNKANEIRLVEEMKWGIPSIHKMFKGIVIGLIIGLIFGMFVGQSVPWPIFGLGGAIIGGFDACFEKQEILQKRVPNQGIHSSLRNLWRMSLIYLVVFSILAVLLNFSIGWFTFDYDLNEFTSSFASGLPVGVMMLGLLFAFMEYGGEAVILHYVLRWVLARQGVLPYPLRDKKLIAYLDAMVERLLLRRVGNGYMFIHRTLMEHFAAKHE